MNEKLQNALEHMNKEHIDSIKNLVKFHKNVDAKEAKLTHLDYEKITINYDGNEFSINYDNKANDETLHYEIINLCTKAKPKEDGSKLNEEIKNYMHSFKSVVIASGDENGFISSYAPIIFNGDEIFIFISEVAEHYTTISKNPNIEIMFLQDEKEAKTVFARIRLRYQVKATILPREERFEELFSILKQRFSEASVFAAMKDFHFVKLSIKSGRYVKGFGAAFSIDEHNNASAIRIEKPHKV